MAYVPYTFGGPQSSAAGITANIVGAEKKGVIFKKKIDCYSTGLGQFRAKNKYNNTKGFDKNPIFKVGAKLMKPDPVRVDNYEKMLAEQYVKALQMQLGGRTRSQSQTFGRVSFSGVGIASKKLYENIRALTKVTVDNDTKNGTYRLRYLIKHELQARGENGEYYGEFLNYDRGTKKIASEPILKWIKQKMKRGTMRLYNKKKEEGKGRVEGKEAFLQRVASRIVSSWRTNRKSAVARNWSIYDENDKLQRDFAMLTKNKGAYHRNRIRKSLIENITK